ncbi:PTS system mannose/fructose/N-acetylgalactosamine-transporter subunit IIB [Fundicoccus culcitae]|uniref:PTS sugar transporter subunit IIB n=1 Tax=Fundicoccus culcitae TaxID=2969821 RepID=A0ABY5P8U2_9LACT|nr:PTS sugar transporter subunit IIB [Fundicoccus culcitae]UUX35169.1 PTS sugar transporter subunit IIB [Fundicoccus culcitae]
MIKHLRLDERLIHGQIAIKWSRNLDINRIIVANDEAGTNKTIERSLMMAAPQNLKVAIQTIDKSIEILKDPRAKDLKILLIVATPQDVLKIINQIKDVDVINVGNYGRIAKKKEGESRKSYGSNLYAYDEEVDIFKEIIASGIKCIYQTTPEDNPEPLDKALKI